MSRISTLIAGVVAGATGPTGPTGATGASGATTTISNGTSNLNIATSGGAIYANTAGTNAITVDTSQNVGIGTVPSYKLHVYIPGDGTTPVQLQTGNSNGILNFYNDSNGWSLDSGGDFRVVTSRSNSGSPTRFYIDGSGNTLFSAARNSARALVDIPTSGGSAGVPLAVSRGGDGGPMVNFYSMNNSTTVIGSIGNASNTNTTYNTSSDHRLKENITPMIGALAKVSALKPVTWKWKSTGSDGQGFIAHELAEVIPDCVTGEKDAVDADGNPVYQGVDTSYLVATLTKAIQELKVINDTQAETINAQDTALAALTARIVALEAK
jgi:hypothetical protein